MNDARRETFSGAVLAGVPTHPFLSGACEVARGQVEDSAVRGASGIRGCSR